LSLEKSIKSDPEIAITHNTYGLALESTGKTSNAIKSYNRALKVDPRLTKAERNYAKIN